MTTAKTGNGDNPNGTGKATGTGTGTGKPNGRRSERKNDLPGIWVGYGKLVRMFRTRARLSREQLAELVGYSVDQVASVEQGRRPAKMAFTEAAESALEAGGVLATLQDEVDMAKLPMFFQDFAQLELGALCRFSFDPLLVPGLLQTEAYARRVFTDHLPHLNDDEIEQSVEGRLARQRLFNRDTVMNLSFIIGEAALRGVVGSEEVMADQMRHLLTIGQLRNVEIQVMPLSRSYHAGLEGAFVLLETLEHRRYGYVESQGIGQVVSDPKAVSALTLRYGKLRSLALDPDESVRLIETLIGVQ